MSPRTVSISCGLLAVACTREPAPGTVVDACAISYGEPADAPLSNSGPGAPQVTFDAEQLMQRCAFLDGGEEDVYDHHNLLSMYDGYLLMPWAPEWGGGGLTLWDVSDPCDPIVVGSGTSDRMRETHAIGYAFEGGQWAVTNYIGGFDEGGAQFWDLSDSSAPIEVSTLHLDGFFYPDAYARVTLSVFWQDPYVFAGGSDNGVYVIDAGDPRSPELVQQLIFEPIMRVGQVQAVGNLLIVTEAEGARTVLLDISDPTDPRPIAGGDFLIHDGEGTTREAYFSNLGGGYVYYARKDGGGGIIIYDVHDPGAPAYVGDVSSEGNGGYVFIKDDLAFVGESSFAAIYDISDPTSPTPVSDAFLLQGDLDTMTPISNFVVLSVDDEANRDEGSAIVPFEAEPDTQGPRVTWAWPSDGAEALPISSRFGVTFSEMVDPKSAHVNSVRLYRADEGPGQGGVAARISVQENVVNLVPSCDLEPDTTYTLEVSAGGVTDFSGNPVEATFQAQLTTGAL